MSLHEFADLNLDQVIEKLKAADYATKQQVEVHIRELINNHDEQIKLTIELRKAIERRQKELGRVLSAVIKSY